MMDDMTGSQSVVRLILECGKLQQTNQQQAGDRFWFRSCATDMTIGSDADKTIMDAGNRIPAARLTNMFPEVVSCHSSSFTIIVRVSAE